jgi:hypothetical protein
MRHLTFNLTDLQSFSTKSYPITVHKIEQVEGFTREVAQDLVKHIPELRRKGMCVALYDEEGRRILVAPLDPVQ